MLVKLGFHFRDCLVKFVLFLAVIGFMLTWGTDGSLAAEGEDQVYTLKESVKLALDKSLAMDSAAKAIEGAGWKKKQAFTYFLPVLSTTYSWTRLEEAPEMTTYTFDTFTIFGNEIPYVSGTQKTQIGTRDNWQAKLTITQPIYSAALTPGYRLAKLGVDVAEISKAQEKLDVVLQAKKAYFSILKAQKALEVVNQAVKQLEAHLNVAKNFFDVGMVAKNQVLQAEVALAERVQDKIKAENGVQLAKASFNTLIRNPLESPVEVEDILTYKPFPQSFSQCLGQALEKRPEIKALEKKIMMARENVKVAKAKYYPSVGLSANYYWKGDTYQVNGSDYLDDYKSWDVTVALTWNFWEWGRSRSGVRASKTDVDQIENAMQQVVDGIALEVKSSYLNLKEAEKNIAVTRKAIEQAEENYRMSTERYNEQVATSTEVIDAATLLTASQSHYYDALYSYNLTWAALERAMGLGRDEI